MAEAVLPGESDDHLFSSFGTSLDPHPNSTLEAAADLLFDN